MQREILLVDDEAGIRKVLGIALADDNYHVYSAASGEEAMRLFHRHRPPIVLTDIKMPGMDGIEVLQAIKKASPDTEVIMITGHGDIDLAIKSLKFEATDFITKPIHDEVLTIALKRASERIEMRRQLRAYTENLQQMVEDQSRQLVKAERFAAVGETVAGLAHAIKNIASGLKGGAFVLEKGIELDTRQYLLQGWEMIKGNVEKITALSLDLLNFAKPTPLDFRKVDPNTLAGEVLRLVKPQSKTHHVSLKLDLCPDLPPVVLDAEAIMRCLLNLMVNAVEACSHPAGGAFPPEIVLRTRQSADWAVEYVVNDNGPGLSAESEKSVFTRFFTTKGSRGTGIGLMLTKKIVEQHGGQVAVQSIPGQGATFFLRLPAVPPAAV
jgi:signal transduction histidine kinase